MTPWRMRRLAEPASRSKCRTMQNLLATASVPLVIAALVLLWLVICLASHPDV